MNDTITISKEEYYELRIAKETLYRCTEENIIDWKKLNNNQWEENNGKDIHIGIHDEILAERCKEIHKEIFGE